LPSSFITKYKEKYTQTFVESFLKRSQAIMAMAEWAKCALTLAWHKNNVKPLREKNKTLITEIKIKESSLKENKINLDKLLKQKKQCDEEIE
jgi:hypothetical protein